MTVLLLIGLLPGAARTFEVPYRLTESHHLIVRARVNGRGRLNLLVDTGAPGLFIVKDSARQAGLITRRGRAWIQNLQFEGGPTLGNVTAIIEDPEPIQGINQMDLAGVRVDGILGEDILARFRIEIDLSQPTMRWTDLGYRPPPAPSMNQLLKKNWKPGEALKRFEELSRFASTLFARKPDPPPVRRGYLGIELVPENRASTHIGADTTAMTAGARIKAVAPGSPAAGAGLAVGDLIFEAATGSSKPVTIFAIADLVHALAKLLPGETVTLTVDRGGKPLSVAVKAGDLAL